MKSQNVIIILADKGVKNMSKTQTPKHEIPKDWSKISDKKAIEYLKYLLKNYKEYKITFGPYGYISVAGIRLKHNPNGIKFGGNYTYDAPNFLVNNKIYDCFRNKDIYLLCNKLFYACKQEVEQQEKIEAEKQKKIERIIKIACICAMIITVAIGGYKIVKIEKRGRQIENKVKQYEKTLPYYKEYELTKQQLQNYRDSLNKVYQ